MEKFDVTRLELDGYDWDIPLHLARLQRTVEDFMALIQNKEVICPDDQGMLDKFCVFVNDPKAWPLAQMVVPEFRSAKEDQQSDADKGREPTSLDYVLDKLSGLPLPHNDKNVLTSEQDLLNQRHKQWVEYVVTGGRGREAATSAEREDVEQRVSHVEKVIGDFHAEYPTLIVPRNSERKGRKGPNLRNDGNGQDGEESEAGEEGPREHAPLNADIALSSNLFEMLS